MSSIGPVMTEAESPDVRGRLESIVQHIAHLLPAQGPINVFIHHNPLHAFEHLPFEVAVQEAARIFGCEPFLSEDRYRRELRCGRIHESHIDAELAAYEGEETGPIALGGLNVRELRRRVLLYGLNELSGQSLEWVLAETTALRRFRSDLPSALLGSRSRGLADDDPGGVSREVSDLWSACLRAIRRTEVAPVPERRRVQRHRDILLSVAETDVDEWIHPVLIRLSSAYLDQGLADWGMAGRKRGLFACFLELYQHGLARWSCPCGAELNVLIRKEIEAGRDSWASLENSLSCLGVPASEWADFLLAELLALRGFAGMVHQFELRPDRVPVFSLPARLVDFLATRLLLLRAALLSATRQVGFRGALRDLRSWLDERLPNPEGPSVHERAWLLFQLAQLTGLSALGIDELGPEMVQAIERELRTFDGDTRRRLLHRAYERHLRHRFYDALAGHSPGPTRQPEYQAIFCIDEREESMRRHLEEVDPGVETFGAAGFFGVAMYYRGTTDAHGRPLCPVAIQPRHFVTEVPVEERGLVERLRKAWNRIGAFVDKNVHLGGRHARLGALLFATVGVLWVLPLVLRVVFPWLAQGVARVYGRLSARPGRLILVHDETASSPPLGDQAGFTTSEMAEIVYTQLSSIGLADRLTPLVLVLGHGSTSLNNPHESAYDCGACGGGRGGPNARAFARMANNPRVRELVALRGLQIPSTTLFVGGERNTASNDIELFDLEEANARAADLISRVRASLEEARRREAHERCRRFESAGLWLPPAAALLHVQARATDLAQPRSECGHATNAVCFVGRRSRTRGLFLDRRAFLVSYDSSRDTDGMALKKLLSAVVPVVAGISLEYYFGYVDPTGYGSGTKLPHNVAALIGVMDGAESDLRTGLPWQMVEIHEPVRLSIVVEADVEWVRRLLEQDPYLRQLVDHGWIYLATLDPDSNALVELDSKTTRPYVAERPLSVSRGSSRQYYQGRRDHLPFSAVEGERGGAP